MYESLTEDNFILFAAKHYENNQCLNIDEFHDDLKRFAYLKRLFGQYKDKGELKERLILNHLIILYNVFGPNTTKMLFFKLDKHHYKFLKPFLILLNYMPETLKINDNLHIYNSDIEMEQTIINKLRNI